MRHYSDKPLEISQLLASLKNGGLLFSDESKASAILQHVSYFRLKSYLIPLMCDKERHVFKKGASFEQAFELYRFDSLLRRLISENIENIEISLRTQMAYILSKEMGIYWFSDESNFITSATHDDLLRNLEKELNRCDDEQILRFKMLYDNPFPPAWMTMEVSTFGTLSMFFKNLRPGLPKREIASSYGINDVVFSSWLHCLVYVRNICAHHGRLWNKEMRIQPLFPRRTHYPFVSPGTSRKRVYYVLCIIQYLLATIVPSSDFLTKLESLLSDFPDVDPTAMGFPRGWEEEPLWCSSTVS